MKQKAFLSVSPMTISLKSSLASGLHEGAGMMSLVSSLSATSDLEHVSVGSWALVWGLVIHHGVTRLWECAE